MRIHPFHKHTFYKMRIIMKKLRRTLIAATAAVALTVSIAPSASAQYSIWDEIDNLNCVELEYGLKSGGLVGKDTTLSELRAILRLADPTGVLGSRIADRAADCGIVKDDSNLSSKLSSGLFSS